MNRGFVDRNQFDFEETPIQAAARAGHTEVVKVLLKANATKPQQLQGEVFVHSCRRALKMMG